MIPDPFLLTERVAVSLPNVRGRLPGHPRNRTVVFRAPSAAIRMVGASC